MTGNRHAQFWNGGGGGDSLADHIWSFVGKKGAAPYQRGKSILQRTSAVKHRKGRRLDHVEVRATIGEAVEQPYAVHLERLNGTLRDRLNCLTRKTHGFAKEVATWDALYRLARFEQNWLRPHLALRVPLPETHDGRLYH